MNGVRISLHAIFAKSAIPMIWVGLPPVSKGNMNTDYLKFNEIYRQTVEAYGGVYVNVWDGFVDTEGRYVRAGPDVNGQIVALRRADGINMTQAGYDKLAFFAEKAVKAHYRFRQGCAGIFSWRSGRFTNCYASAI